VPTSKSKVCLENKSLDKCPEIGSASPKLFDNCLTANIARHVHEFEAFTTADIAQL